jgi:hypothetical protein
VNLKNFELSASTGEPLVNCLVTILEASPVHPSPYHALHTTWTDRQGMWEFTDLEEGRYDVCVEHYRPGWPPSVKWYKDLGVGNAKPLKTRRRPQGTSRP